MGKGAHRVVFTGIITGLAIAGSGRAVASTQEQHTLLRVAAVNHARVAEGVWERAHMTASRIYQSAGIKVIWIDSAVTTGASTLRSDLTIIVSAAPSAPGLTSSKHVLGFALEPRRHGRVAYVFYGRIQDFARDIRADAGAILGHVIAHEMGHLLLSRAGHSLFGLMRGRWYESHTELARGGVLTFTNDETAVIRARAAELSAEIAAKGANPIRKPGSAGALRYRDRDCRLAPCDCRLAPCD